MKKVKSKEKLKNACVSNDSPFQHVTTQSVSKEDKIKTLKAEILSKKQKLYEQKHSFMKYYHDQEKVDSSFINSLKSVHSNPSNPFKPLSSTSFNPLNPF